MNKYQEAKETLEKYDYSTKLELSEGVRNNVTSDITIEQFFMMKETCVELLDKAAPKKPIIYKHSGNIKCWCGLQMYEEQQDWYRYCATCGQKIDWGNEE